MAGGAEKHLAETFGRLTALGHRVVVLSSGFKGGRRVARHRGMAIVRVGGPLSFFLAARPVVRHLLSRSRFTMVVEDLNKIPLFLASSASHRTIVLVHHLWRGSAFRAAAFPIALVTWLSERLIPLFYRRAGFIAVSPSTGRDLVALGIPSSSVAVVQNACSPTLAPPTFRRASIPTFLYLGRLQRYKRVHRLIRAARELRDEGQVFQVWIAGTGREEQRLRRMVRRLDLADRVTFLGPVSEAEKTALYRQAWANVLMSEREGWGLTILEAAAEQTCSVVAFAPGLWDAVQHLETGLWVPYHELPKLSDALRYLALNPGAAWRLGTEAYRRCRRRTWDRAARELEAALGAMVDPAPPDASARAYDLPARASVK
jgi:glycosyltransferase involved in cell wall biosynthesis